MGLWDTLKDTAVSQYNMARGRYKYSPLANRNPAREAQEALGFWSNRHRTVLKCTMAALALLFFYHLATATA